MALKFNADAKKQRTEQAFNAALAEIEHELDNGNKIIHLYIDKEVAPDVRTMLNELFKKEGVDNHFDWGTVRRSPNEFTGRMQYFTGETIGDQKHYKLYYEI